MFEVESNSKLKLKLYGEEFEIEAPSAHSLNEVQERVKAAGEKQENTLQVWVDWMISLGMKAELLNRLELKNLSALIDYVSGVKKN